MGQKYDPVVEYLRLPGSSGWEMALTIILLLLIILILYLGMRRQRFHFRTSDLLGLSKKGKSRRKAKRIHYRAPLMVKHINGQDINEVDILDISSGGMKLLTFQDDYQQDDIYKIISDAPPWNLMREPEFIVLNTSKGPVVSTQLLNCRWKHITRDEKIMMKKELGRLVMKKV